MPARIRAAEIRANVAPRVPRVLSLPIRARQSVTRSWIAVYTGLSAPRFAGPVGSTVLFPRAFCPGSCVYCMAKCSFCIIHTNDTCHSCIGPLNTSTSCFSADTVNNGNQSFEHLGTVRAAQFGTHPATPVTAHPPPSFQSTSTHFAIRDMQAIVPRDLSTTFLSSHCLSHPEGKSTQGAHGPLAS